MTRFAIAAALALAVTLPAVSAQALALRTFVSTTGSDTNPCTITQPCRHFQAAVDATAVGGEVDALDAGSYSPITISQAITIDGQGWSYLAPMNNNNGITINAVSGDVIIRGVSINGVGTSNTNGIVFNSGSSLTVTNCILQNLVGSDLTVGNGILMQPTSATVKFAITNTTISNNGYMGFLYYPHGGSTTTANGVIDHMVATNNTYGIAIDTASGGGSTTAAISNSVASDNGLDGIYIQNSNPLAVSIDNSSANGNQEGEGIAAFGTPNVTLGRSVITANVDNGVFNGTSPNSFHSYNDNRINGNVAGDVLGPMLSDALK
jgi:hypothetical protein